VIEGTFIKMHFKNNSINVVFADSITRSRWICTRFLL